jgi:hypothetical protein
MGNILSADVVSMEYNDAMMHEAPSSGFEESKGDDNDAVAEAVDAVADAVADLSADDNYDMTEPMELPEAGDIRNNPAFWSVLGYIATKVESGSQIYFRPDISVAIATKAYSEMVLFRAVYALMLNPLAVREFPPLCNLSDRLYNYSKYMAMFIRHLIQESTQPLSHAECEVIIEDAVDMADIADCVAIDNGEYENDAAEEDTGTETETGAGTGVGTDASVINVPSKSSIEQVVEEAHRRGDIGAENPLNELGVTNSVFEQIIQDLLKEPEDIRDEVLNNHNGMLLAYVADWIRRRDFEAPSPPDTPPMPVARPVTVATSNTRATSSQQRMHHTKRTKRTKNNKPKESLVSPTTQVIRRSARIAAQRNRTASVINY